MWSREGRQFARHPLSSLWPSFPVAPYGGCCLECEFIQLFWHLCQGHFLLFILADFFQAQVKTSTLQGSTSTFLLLFAPHIMATTCKVYLSGKPQAANMLRQAEQKTLPCTEEEFLVCPLALKKKTTGFAKIYLPSKLCSHKCAEIQTHIRCWLNCLFSLSHEKIQRLGQPWCVWVKTILSLTHSLMSFAIWQRSLNQKGHFHGNKEETRSRVAVDD